MLLLQSYTTMVRRPTVYTVGYHSTRELEHNGIVGSTMFAHVFLVRVLRSARAVHIRALHLTNTCWLFFCWQFGFNRVPVSFTSCSCRLPPPYVFRRPGCPLKLD